MEVSSVEERHVDGDWIVCIIEDGNTYEQVFQVEIFAKSWAAGQKRRLGLTNEAHSDPGLKLLSI